MSSIAKTHVRKVEKYFSLVVDDFFTNPKVIVDYLKSQPSQTSPDGSFPGKRTDPIHTMDEELNKAIMLKILGCYYDVEYQNLSWNLSWLTFHTITPFSEDKNDVRNKGWIHQDVELSYDIAGLIYLNENADPNAGTSIFKLKEDDNFVPSAHLASSHLFKKGEYDEEYYTEQYNNHVKHFVEKTRFQNIYNRLIMYDPREFHGPNNYCVGNKGEDRLTLVFFIGGVQAGRFPLNRIKHEEYDSYINYRCRGKKR